MVPTFLPEEPSVLITVLADCGRRIKANRSGSERMQEDCYAASHPPSLEDKVAYDFQQASAQDE